MDKLVMRTVVQSLVAGDNVSVTFRDQPSKEFRVDGPVLRKQGRGGSFLANLVALDGSGPMALATPNSANVINICKSDGVLHGFASQADEPVVLPVDTDSAATLKNIMKPVVKAGDASVGRTVRMVSSLPELNGTFTYVNGKFELGKHGQAHLWLRSVASSDVVEVYSHRHSGVISEFHLEPLPVPAAATPAPEALPSVPTVSEEMVAVAMAEATPSEEVSPSDVSVAELAMAELASNSPDLSTSLSS